MVSPNLKIEELISQTKDLPSIPAAAMAVLKEVDNPTSNAQSIAKILLQDQSLSTRVLRLANSAYYGLARRVGDVQEAVVILGMRSVRNLSLVAGTYPWLSKEIAGYALGPKALWTHSLAVAIGAQLVAKTTRRASPDECFMTGLLHDMGKVVLAVHMEAKIDQIMALSERENVPFDEAERRFLGFDHCDVGAHLATKWNLPEVFAATMQFHHNPSDASDFQPIVDCIHLGDYLASSFGFGLGGDGLSYPVCQGSIDRLALDAPTFETLLSTFPEVFVEAEKAFDLLN